MLVPSFNGLYCTLHILHVFQDQSASYFEHTTESERIFVLMRREQPKTYYNVCVSTNTNAIA